MISMNRCLMNSGSEKNETAFRYERIHLDFHQSARLSATAAAALVDSSNDLYLSAVSVWEMQIKIQIGKLSFIVPLRQLVNDEMQKQGIHLLPIDLEHIYALHHLPFHHKDPFDRLLVAQAQIENLTLVSGDPALSSYSVNVIW